MAKRVGQRRVPHTAPDPTTPAPVFLFSRRNSLARLRFIHCRASSELVAKSGFPLFVGARVARQKVGIGKQVGVGRLHLEQ